MHPLLVLGAGALVTVVCWTILKPWTERTNFAIQAVNALNEKTRVLILGTSHVDCGIDPSALGAHVKNLSGVALNYEGMEGAWMRHMDRLKSLETLVIELDIFAFRYDTVSVIGDSRELLMDLDPDLSKMEIGFRDWFELRKFAFLRRSWVTSPFWSRYRLSPSEILSWDGVRPRVELNGDGEGVTTPGFRAFEQKMTHENDGPAKVATHMRESSSDMIPRNTRALIRIIRSAQSRDLRVVLLRLPHPVGYRTSRRAQLDPEFDQATAQVYASVDKSKLEMWDYDQVDAMTDDDFYDGDHINGSGARIFTQILKERL